MAVGGFAYANVNCSHDCSLAEITAIMPCYAMEELSFFLEKNSVNAHITLSSMGFFSRGFIANLLLELFH